MQLHCQIQFMPKHIFQLNQPSLELWESYMYNLIFL